MQTRSRRRAGVKMDIARWVANGLCTTSHAMKSSATGRRVSKVLDEGTVVMIASSAGLNSLKIRNVNLDDDGIYQCQIGRTVQAREVLSNFANLTVLIPPSQISVTLVLPGTIISGKEFTVQCEVLNTRPAPVFTWQTPLNAQIVNVSRQSEPMANHSKLLRSISTITLIADINQHGREITCEALHVALNKSLIATMMIAVNCKANFVAFADYLTPFVSR